MQLSDKITQAGWQVGSDEKSIHKTYQFSGFADAMAFIQRCAFSAQRQNHHPEWSNVYNKVNVILTTHDADALTEQDIKLAEAMDKIAAKFGR